MNKTEFIKAVAEKSGLSKKEATAAVAAALETITQTIKEETVVTINVAGYNADSFYHLNQWDSIQAFTLVLANI